MHSNIICPNTRTYLLYIHIQYMYVYKYFRPTLKGFLPEEYYSNWFRLLREVTVQRQFLATVADGNGSLSVELGLGTLSLFKHVKCHEITLL